MEAVEVKPDVYWVGGIDWNLRDFHGYITQRGATYNFYLILDEKVTLIDTVKHYLSRELVERIKNIIDPSSIDYIVVNHVEMDHSGVLPSILKLASKAKIITSPSGEKGLRRHYDTSSWEIKVVENEETILIGERELTFIHLPMIHWPDSMATYSSKDKILFPNDTFGQHIATDERFDDELNWGILYEEAAKYYANIVLPYSSQVKKIPPSILKLRFGAIAPSHGVIWHEYLDKIIEVYKRWSENKSLLKAVIVYDTMWGSTGKLALSLYSGLISRGVHTSIRNLNNTHVSDIMTDVLDARIILIGSPTINNSMMPTVRGFLTYLKALHPRNKIGFVFESYGWGGQAVREVEETLRGLSWDSPIESININFIPKDEDLKQVKKIGEEPAGYVLEKERR